MKRVRVLFAPENRGFADILAASLAEGGFEPVAADQRYNAAMVLWTPASVRSAPVISAAREALAERVLVPVAIGKTPPPASFEHLWPVDLAGWRGDIADPRWRFAVEELEIALRRRAAIGSDAVDADAAFAPAPAYAMRAGGAIAQRRAYAAPPLAPPGDSPPRRGPLIAPGAPIRIAEPPLESPAPPPSDVVALDEDEAAVPILLDDDRALERFTPAPAPPARPLRAALVGGGVLALVAAIAAGAYAISLRYTPGGSTPLRSEPPIVAYVEQAAAGQTDGADAPGTDDEQDAAAGASPADVYADVVTAPGETTLAPASALQSLAESAIEEHAAAEAAAAGEDPIAGLAWESTRDEAAEEAYFGNYFRECLECPDMAVLETGAFMLGSPADEPGRDVDEGPTVDVEIARRFAMSTREITFAQWDACVDDGGCAARLADGGFGRGKRPAINVSWSEARAFAAWLSNKTGSNYRLPTEAEWEYAARGGRDTPFSFGDALGADKANYDGSRPFAGETGIRRAAPLPAGSFAPNAFGLFDMHGNVWEWTADCWSPGHASASPDGAAVGGACDLRVIKGGGWNSAGADLRAAARDALAQGARRNDVGLRIVRDMP